MATLRENIEQAIADFDNIENSIESYGVDVPRGTDTKEYGNLISKVYNSGIYDAGYEQGKKVAEKKPYIDTSKITDFSYLCVDNKFNDELAKLDMSNGILFRNTFNGCNMLKTIPALNTSNGIDFSGMFWNCTSLTTIQALDLSNGEQLSDMFYYCKKLQNVNFIGKIIGYISVGYSPELTVDSILSLLNALEDLTGQSSMAVLLGDTNIAKLTTEQLNIATKKNWVVN